MIGRKGDEEGISTVIKLIIILVVGVLFLGVIKIFDKGMNKTVPKQVCKDSVYMHSLLEHRGIRFADSEMRCPTRDVLITRKMDQEEAKKEVADALYDCWDQYHRGRLSLFEDERTYCAVCHVIDFEEGYGDGELGGLIDFLATKRVPGGSLTYLSFMQGYQTENADWLMQQIGNSPDLSPPELYAMDTAKRYSTVFVYTKGRDGFELMKSLMEEATETSGFNILLVSGVVVMAGALTVASGGFLATVIGGAMVAGGGKLFAVSGAEVVAESWIRADTDYDHISFVVLREFTSEELDRLGCEVLANN